MRLEQLDRRVLGAIRFLDATTGLSINAPILVSATGVNFVRNRSGFAVVFATPGYPDLQAHTEVFEQPPPTPNLETVSIVVQVTDPNRQYLPRRYTLKLPRDPAVENASAENSLFRPQDVLLYRAPIARTASGWAVIRGVVKDATTLQRLPWALIRVVQSGKVAWSLADWRGEASIAVPEIPAITFSSDPGAVMTAEVEITLEARFDPSVQKIPDANDWFSIGNPNPDYIPDPDFLKTLPAKEVSLRSRDRPYKLASGQDRAETLLVAQ